MEKYEYERNALVSFFYVVRFRLTAVVVMLLEHMQEETIFL
jgi:hypothetical protein